MPKSRVTKRAKAKKVGRNKRKQSVKKAREMHAMYQALENYEEILNMEPLEIDGEIYLNPYQDAAIRNLIGDEEKENEDAQ